MTSRASGPIGGSSASIGGSGPELTSVGTRRLSAIGSRLSVFLPKADGCEPKATGNSHQLRRIAGLVALAALMCLVAVPVFAQDDPAPRVHRLTFSGGLSWLGGYAIGGRAADIRRNVTGTATPPPFTLFREDASFEQVSGLEARIGFALTRALAVEVGGAYARPPLSVVISQDAEADPTTLDAERISQYAVDVSAVWQIPGVRFGSRIRPYATGGGGYLRQLHEGRTRVDTGKVLHVGGGVRYWLRGGDATRHALGVRAELRGQVRSGGIEFAGQSRAFPVFNLFGFFGF